jgi:uncharacterized membrane protein
MYGEIGYYALWGFVLVGLLFVVTQIVDIRRKQFSRRTLLLSAVLCGVAVGYLYLLGTGSRI